MCQEKAGEPVRREGIKSFESMAKSGKPKLEIARLSSADSPSASAPVPFRNRLFIRDYQTGTQVSDTGSEYTLKPSDK